jgi:NADH dehydrogenase [ubiquinone] 1 alpha subcomplex assembly factor 7
VGGGGVFVLVCAESSRQSDAVKATKEKLLRLIRVQGPISIAHYMAVALTDPEGGYYMGRDPLGRDFITAPEVSQIFGELIGLFFVQAWEDRGRPGRFHLVELGPGRGTLMMDLLRAAKVRPGFGKAAQITLIEASPVLREVQANALKGVEAIWAKDLRGVPDDAPLFLIANEFFDALPIEQFVRLGGGWHERMVGAEGEELIFVVAPDSVPESLIPVHIRGAPEGSIFESSSAAQALMEDIGGRVTQGGGAALIIDYGHTSSALGDTFQAVKAHAYTNLLSEPGEADLTAHVDFDALSSAARAANAHVLGPVSQKTFLDSLGIGLRAQRLKRVAPAESAAIDATIDRLINPRHMGTLFKVMAISDGRDLPGFSCGS